MIDRRLPMRWLSGPLLGVRDLGLGDIALAGLLSFYGIWLVTGNNSRHLDGGWTAALAVLLMTVPAVFARRQPLLAAGTLAAGAGLNWVAIGPLIRCGATLPAVFFVSFTIGTRCERRQVVYGEALLAVAIVCQGASDPKLGSPLVAVFMVPLALVFMGAGRLLRARNATVDALQVRTAELRVQREQNAKLAVEADRARIGGDLDAFLRDRVRDMATTAAAGRATLDSDPGQAQEAFASIQSTGRETLTHMREVVASLRDQAPTEPQPVLAQLDRLLSQADLEDARLEVTGDRRMLPPGLDLSSYRIVEHLLLTLEREPTAPITVEVAFGPDSLQLKVVGPGAGQGDARAALAAATERAELHGGTLRSTSGAGRRETIVLLPLAVGQV
jgi:signal transduction histidine kinase